jgi:hypothetical protein
VLQVVISRHYKDRYRLNFGQKLHYVNVHHVKELVPELIYARPSPICSAHNQLGARQHDVGEPAKEQMEGHEPVERDK